jgi:rhamnulokinase
MVYESLALTYRRTIDTLAELVGAELGTLHVVGGGCQNRLLNQFTANARGRRVIAGPVEATALGNVISQMVADGSLPDLRAGRQLISDSFDLETFDPQDQGAWQDAVTRLTTLRN